MTAVDLLFDQPARVDVAIWIPGAVADVEALPEVFEDDFCQYLPEKPDHVLYAQLPDLARFAGKYPDPSDVADVLRDCRGFLIKAETPIKTFHVSSVQTYTWGYTRFSWLYAASEAEIANVVIAWAKSVDAAIRGANDDPINLAGSGPVPIEPREG